MRNGDDQRMTMISIKYCKDYKNAVLLGCLFCTADAVLKTALFPNNVKDPRYPWRFFNKNQGGTGAEFGEYFRRRDKVVDAVMLGCLLCTTDAVVTNACLLFKQHK